LEKPSSSSLNSELGRVAANDLPESTERKQMKRTEILHFEKKLAYLVLEEIFDFDPGCLSRININFMRIELKTEANSKMGKYGGKEKLWLS
jgi:hypothetical protein